MLLSDAQKNTVLCRHEVVFSNENQPEKIIFCHVTISDKGTKDDSDAADGTGRRTIGLPGGNYLDC